LEPLMQQRRLPVTASEFLFRECKFQCVGAVGVGFEMHLTKPVEWAAVENAIRSMFP
jgi:hypothetical protein